MGPLPSPIGDRPTVRRTETGRHRMSEAMTVQITPLWWSDRTHWNEYEIRITVASEPDAVLAARLRQAARNFRGGREVAQLLVTDGVTTFIDETYGSEV